MELKDILGEDFHPDMTIKEINEKLAEMELIDKSELDGKIDKKRFDKLTSDYSKLKKEFNKTKTEEEQKLENFNELKEELEKLKREKGISENKAKFLTLGFSEDVALSSAEALLEGEMDIVFSNFAKFTQDNEKKIKKELLEQTPRPDFKDQNKKIKKEDVQNMSIREMQELANTDRNAFDILFKGE